MDYFVRRHARQIGKVVDDVSPESMQRLQAYPWPGNIRELRSVVERAILVAKSSVLEIDEELLDERLSVGSYRLIEPLGSGGMGEVWRARHRLLARPAAIKLIRHDSQTGVAREELVRRFQREAQVTSALRSPHTVQLYDFGVDDSGGFYYVMELLEGMDMQTMVKRFGPQPAERVVMLLRQACRSLAEAHEHGLVHRDIKPANLFVTRLGYEYDYLKVLDFGIVKDQLSGYEVTMLSTQGLLPGTPAFMAPELDHRRNDRRPGGSLFACLRGLLGADRAARLPGELTADDAHATRPDDTGAAFAGVGAAHPEAARSRDHDVPRERSRKAIVVRARARRTAGGGPRQVSLDERSSEGVVGAAAAWAGMRAPTAIS